MNGILEYQTELMKGYEESNKLANEQMSNLIINGHKIIQQGIMTGPYTEYMHYWFDNGQSFTLIYAASLLWAYKHPIIDWINLL